MRQDDPLRLIACARGTQLPQAKLNEKLVQQIRETIELRTQVRKVLSNYTNEAIAKEYGVHVRTIDKVVQELTWLHV